jgi:hypothetical protein
MRFVKNDRLKRHTLVIESEAGMTERYIRRVPVADLRSVPVHSIDRPPADVAERDH